MINAAEARTSAATVAADGRARLVVCSRGWVLVVDPETGSCIQLDLPDESFPFASLATTDGHLVTGGSGWLVDVDPIALTVTTHRVCANEEVVGFGFAEGIDGDIWLSTYPNCLLVRWDRHGGNTSAPVALSGTEQYAAHLAVDAAGWVYAGIGTTERSIVGLPPGSDAVLPIVTAAGSGSGYVRQGADGVVYGHLSSPEIHPDAELGPDWLRLHEGESASVATAALSAYTGRGFGRVHQVRPAPWQVAELDLAEHRLITAHPQPRETTLRYVSAGAELSPFTLGATGRLHGTSNHPLQLYDLDPRTAAPTIHGLAPVAAAGGNICAWAPWGRLLLGVAYAGGHVYLLDPDRPVQTGSNPRHLGRYDEIFRPRCATVVGDQLVWGGYGGYGDTGGALAVTDLNTGDTIVHPHSKIVIDQATTTLTVVDQRLLLGATSIEAPGGASPSATTATVYLFDLDSGEVTDRWRPALDVRTWSAAVHTASGGVHLVSSEGRHYLSDPGDGSTTMLADHSDLGPVAFGGVVLTREGMWVIQRSGVTRVLLADHRTEVVARSTGPLTAGGAVVGSDLYVGSGARLLRLRGVVS